MLGASGWWAFKAKNIFTIYKAFVKLTVKDICCQAPTRIAYNLFQAK